MADDHRDEFDLGEAPLLLLPVRLETRFEGDDLKIRIYPDQVHLDAHAPLLTAAEVELGTAYWNRRLDGDADGARDALVAELPPRRAVWVARETRPAVADSGERAFPRLRTRTGTKPATAKLIPDRWCAVGYAGGEQAFVAFGEPVPHPLSCAPDLAELVPYDPDGEALPVDEAMAWMVDYDRALAAGMAITVDVSGVALGADGLTLIVVGIRDASRPEQDLLELIEAHHYAEGMEVVAQGTPSNNTDEAASGWTADVDDVAALFARELDDEGLAPAEGSAAAQLTRALGIEDGSLLRRLPGAERDEDAAMAAMNRALWPVTWGRYLDDLLAPEEGPSVVPGATHTALKDHFVEHVRGGAPLPALAVGAQPYGLLPLMLRDGGDLHSADPLVALEAVLLDLREGWREALPAVARLDPVDGGAGDEVATEVLGLLPHPNRFVVRRLTWQWDLRTSTWSVLWGLTGQPGGDLAGMAAVRDATFHDLDSVEEELGVLRDLHEDPSLAGVARSDFDDARTVLDSFIAMCEAHLARQTPINEWYPGGIVGVFDDWVTSDPKILFSDYGNATADRLFNRALVTGPGPAPAEYLGALRERVPTRRAQSGGAGAAGQLDFGGDEPLLYQLIDPVVESIPPAQGSGYRAALDTLAGRAPDELELRLRETLGLASHRLDAWLTGFASRALAAHRDAGRGDLKLGGFGFVERLLPDAASTRESQGFVHAPSLAHAATAAVLRAGWSAHGADDPESLMAVDLRSERVRTAAYLLDGVRQGGSLGDLLGCRFERRLHDAGLDQFVDPCRRRVLEAAGIERDPRGPLDGLALAELYAGAGVEIDPAGGAPFVVSPATPETDPERAALQHALDDIGRGLDAVGDAAIADSVHHFLQGNSERASATLDGIATGAVPPPELRGLTTPRPGASVTHRVLVMLAVEGDGGTAWGPSPRGALEPGLEAWVAGLLGAPSRARLEIVVTATEERIGVTFADLVASQGMGALDAVFEGEAEWADRARAHVLSQPERAEDEDGLEVLMAPADVAAPQVAAADFAELTAALRALLGRARPLDARDLAMPGTDVESGIDPAAAEARVEGFRAGLAAAADALAALLPAPTETDPTPAGEASLQSIRAAMSALAGFGVAHAMPVRGYAEGGRASLYADAWAALAAARSRLDEAAALEAAPATDAEARARHARALASALAGRGFPLLTSYTTDPAAIDDALARGDELLAGDPARAMGWLRTVARVRADTRRLDDAITAAELIDDEARVRPLVGQMPAADGARWVALDAAADRRQSMLSLFVVDGGGRAPLSAAAPAAGLVVDTWGEVVPVEDVPTGVAINFDAPTSRPPQSLLLALPPDGRRWSFDHVVATVFEGFEAAKLRAVDPDVLIAPGHQVPAIFPPGSISAGPQEELVG